MISVILKRNEWLDKICQLLSEIEDSLNSEDENMNDEKLLIIY